MNGWENGSRIGSKPWRMIGVVSRMADGCWANASGQQATVGESARVTWVSKFWRLLLLCVMVLVLPVQGVAASAMMHCAGGSMPVRTVAAPTGQQADDHAQHHHGAAAEQSLQADGADPTDRAGTTHSADDPAPPGHKCSACSACCAGMGLPASVAPLSVPELSCTPAWVSATSSLTFIASGPERPPRQTLA